MTLVDVGARFLGCDFFTCLRPERRWDANLGVSGGHPETLGRPGIGTGGENVSSDMEMTNPTEIESSSEQRELFPGEKRRRVLWWFYAPYQIFVFIPVLASTTLVMGILAAALAKWSPRAAFHFGTAWSWLLCRVNWTKVTVEGRENAQQGQSYIVMSNHQSHFDILAFYGHWGRQFRWVMKEELRRVPGLGWYCDAGGHVFIDRSSHEKALASLRAATDVLSGGISVMIFPEGTRSRDGRIQGFKKGGFVMAEETGLPILPVSISGSYRVLPGHSFNMLPGRVRITIHEPVDPKDYEGDRDGLMQAVRQSILSGLTPWERGEET